MTEEIIEIDEVLFKIYRYSEKEVQGLVESRKIGRQLVGTYTYDIHKPHNSTGEYHLHLRDKGKEILSINKVSGTAHDGYHGTRIPNKAFKALKDHLPDWNWPSNQIIESVRFTYIMNNQATNYLRPVSVFKHKNFALQDIDNFLGFFHRFAEDPFSTGGSGGWKERTIAVIETEDGFIRKVPVDCFRFIDV